jgi:hypothetical protein
MASVQKSVNAHKSMHHDHQQLGDVKSVLMDHARKLNNTDNSRTKIAKLTKLALEVLNVKSFLLMDCVKKLNNTDNSQKEIAKSTKLALEVLNVIGDETQAGLMSPAPSRSLARPMTSEEAEKRRELAEETGIAMSENDQEKLLPEFLKQKKSPAGKNARATTSNGSSIIGPSPKKKACRSERQKLTQNEQCPHAPDNGKLFLPVELCNMLLPLDSAARTAFAFLTPLLMEASF